MKKEFTLSYVFAIIALIFASLQGILFLFAQDLILNVIYSDEFIQDLLNQENITQESLKASMTFLGCLALALAAWFGLAINQMKTGNAFIHFLIPSILSLILGIWLVSICGFIAGFSL